MDESVASKPGLAGEVVSYLLLGSEESFDAFVAAQAPALQRTAFLLTGDHGAAEELVQDTLLRVWAR